MKDALLGSEADTEDRRNGRRVLGGLRSRDWLSIAAGIVAGYLLWRLFGDRGAGPSDDGRVDVSEITSRIRERPAVEAVRPTFPEAPGDRATTTTPEVLEDRPESTTDAVEERPPGPATVPDVVESDDVERAVETLSSPTVRGMPMLGVGTHHHAGYDECAEAVGQALRMGYRHVDTTVQREAYYNEPAVGEAVADSGVPREDVFVATKVDPADLDPEHVRISVEESLDRLGMDYVDLLYPRWPTENYEAGETLGAFADLLEEGLIRRIGVSNFTVDLLEEAIEASPYPIFANQVEIHPLLPQAELRAFCTRDDVSVELVGYSPLARGDVEDVDELQDVAAKHGASPEQVSLAWLREKGVCAIPRATSAEHLRENWLSLGIDLDEGDVATLDGIEERRRIVDPDDAPWNR